MKITPKEKKALILGITIIAGIFNVLLVNGVFHVDTTVLVTVNSILAVLFGGAVHINLPKAQ